MNEFSYFYRDRTQFRITIDTFNGSVGGIGGSSSAQAAALALKGDPSAMLDLNNLIVDTDGVARRRGAIKDGLYGANALAALSGASFHLMKPGDFAAAVGNSAGTSVKYYAQNTTAAGTLVATVAAASVSANPKGPSPTVKGTTLVHAGARVSTNPLYNGKYGGCVMLQGATTLAAPVTTGTATMTAGSTIVTLTNAPGAVTGAFFTCTSDSAAYQRAYVIRDVNGAVLTLDEPYQGDAAGATKNYSIDPLVNLKIGTTGPWGTSANAQPLARVACEHAGRLFLGWTQEAALDTGTGQLLTDPEFPYRLRWSGLIGARESSGQVVQGNTASNAAMQGLFAFSKSGYFDLNPSYGGIIAMHSSNGALIVWQQRGMTILYGSPNFANAGSLDGATRYDDVRIAGGWAYQATEYGVFFVDSKHGAMVYTGGGRPQPLANMTRSIRSELQVTTAHVGYVNNHLIFEGFKFSGSQYRRWVYHVPSRRWTLITSPVGGVSSMAYFWNGDTNECQCLVPSGINQFVCSLDNLFNPDGTVTDSPLGSAFNISLQTMHFGFAHEKLRPRTLFVTLRATGTPATIVTLVTGLPYDQDSGHQDPWTILNAPTGTLGADLETIERDAIQIGADNTLSIKVSDSGGLLGHFELVQIHMEGTVEGFGSST